MDQTATLQSAWRKQLHVDRWLGIGIKSNYAGIKRQCSYTVTGTTNGCSNSAIVNVSVTPKPTVTVDAVSPICSGETGNLQAHGADSYTWTGGSVGIEPTTPVLTSTTSYTVTGTTNNCSNTAIANVTVTTTPVMPSITQSGDTLHSSSILVGASCMSGTKEAYCRQRPALHTIS